MTVRAETWTVCVLVIVSDWVIETISELSMPSSVVSVAAVDVLTIGDETGGALVAD